MVNDEKSSPVSCEDSSVRSIFLKHFSLLSKDFNVIILFFSGALHSDGLSTNLREGML